MIRQVNRREQQHFETTTRGINLEEYMVKTQSKQNPNILKPSNPNLDYGTFNQFKLDDLINLQSDGFNEPKVIRLAFIQNNSIHLQQSAIELFQKYAKHELSFIGFYGKSKAGKSLMLDKILNLCQFNGANFTKIRKKEKGLYIWAIPLSRNSTKVFLLDIDGYQKQIDNSYFMLLDLLLFLSSTMVFVAQPRDYDFQELETIIKHIKKQKSKFTQNSKGTYWPTTSFCMLRQIKSFKPEKLLALKKKINETYITVTGNAINQKIGKQETGLELISAQLKKFGNHKKIISEEYIKRISGMIREAVSKIQVRVYMNLKFTGANLNKLIVNAIQQLNIKNHLDIQKIYKKSMKQLYIDAFNYHTMMYNQNLIEFLEEEEPMEYDQLIKAFKVSSDNILESFKTLKVNQELRQLYYRKLQIYISQKEKLILQVNKKKLKNKIKTMVPNLKPKPSPQELFQFINQAKQVPKNLQQVYIQEITSKLVAGMSHFQYTIGKQLQARQKEQQYVKKLQEKLNELRVIQKQKSRKTASLKQALTTKINLQAKEKKLGQAANKLKIEIAKLKMDKPKAEEDLKKSKSTEMLKKQEAKLIQEKQAKQKIIQQLKVKQGTRIKEKLEIIQSQISQKVSQQKQLQNILSSNARATSIQVLKSATLLSLPRKVQSRVFTSPNTNIRVISSKI